MRSERRLATTEFYSHYFSFSHREDYPTTEFVADVAAHLDDETVFKQALSQVRSRLTPVGTTLTGRFLTELADRIEAKNLPTGKLLKLLLELGDDLVQLDDEEDHIMFSVSNYARVRRLLPLCVRSTPQHNRNDTLVSLVQAANAPWTATSLWWTLAEEHGIVGDRPAQPEDHRLVTREGLDGLGAALVDRLHSLASGPPFTNSPHLGWILRAWVSAGADKNDVSNWIRSHLNDPKLVWALADGMMGKSRPVGEKRWRHKLRRDVTGFDHNPRTLPSRPKNKG
jgi:hypothetical protein